MNLRRSPRSETPAQRVGLARALSKLGFCSRRQAWELIEAGRVRVNSAVRRDPEWRVDLGKDRLEVDEQAVENSAKVYLMLNKPRGLVTSTSDEQGRETVYACLAGQGLPFVAPVGRLDKASEGLLLLTNDSAWAARITAPESHIEKTYHVQVDRLVDAAMMRRMSEGVIVEGDFLAAKRVNLLRQGSRNCWLEIVLDEGKNRHIRRLLSGLSVGVLRLMRVAVGRLRLGDLGKGQFRRLTREEVEGVSLKSSERVEG